MSDIIEYEYEEYETAEANVLDLIKDIFDLFGGTEAVVYGATFRMMNKSPDLNKQACVYSTLSGTNFADILIHSYFHTIYGSLSSIYYDAKRFNNICDDLILLPQLPKDRLLQELNKIHTPPKGKQHYIESYCVGILPLRHLMVEAIDYILTQVEGADPTLEVTRFGFGDTSIIFEFTSSTVKYTHVIDLKTPVDYGDLFHIIIFADQDIATKKVDIDSRKRIIINCKDPRFPAFDLGIDINNLSDKALITPLVLLGDHIDEKNKGTKIYKQSDHMLRKLNLRIKDIRKAVNEDPQYKKSFQHCMLTMHIDLMYDNAQGAMDYTMEFFKKYYLCSATSPAAYQKWQLGLHSTTPDLWQYYNLGNLIYTRKDQEESDFSVGLINIKIEYIRVVEKVISKHHGYCKKYFITGNGCMVTDDDDDQGSWIKLTNPPKEIAATYGLYLYRQINDTQCEELYIAGMDSYGSIKKVDDGWMTGLGSVPIDPNADPLQNKYLIPFLPDVQNKSDTLKKRADGFYQSLKIHILGHSDVHVPWYATATFQALLMAVEFVIAAFTGPIGIAVLMISMAVLSNPNVQAYLAKLFMFMVKVDPFNWILKAAGVSEEDRLAIYKVELLIASFAVAAAGGGSVIAQIALSLGNAALQGETTALLKQWEEDLENAEKIEGDKFNEQSKKLRKEYHLDVHLGDVAITALYRKIDMYPEEGINGYFKRKLSTENAISKSINVAYNYQDIINDFANIQLKLG